MNVLSCDGEGDCTSACMVNVFETDENHRCVVVNDELCFGCMACVAQCLKKGVVVNPIERTRYLSSDELLR